jgi:rubredoxin
MATAESLGSSDRLRAIIDLHGNHLVLQNAPSEDHRVRKWQCMICSFIYEEELGLPEDGIAPGTSWDEIPDDWMCPDCGVGKEDFEMVEI